MRSILFTILFFLSLFFKSQQERRVISGVVLTSDSNLPVQNVVVKLAGTYYSTASDNKGSFTLKVPPRARYRLIFSHISFESCVKYLDSTALDTTTIIVKLKTKTRLLTGVDVLATNKPETLVGKPTFSIYDFDFIEDKFLLLTAVNSLKNAQVKVSDYDGNISASFDVPKSAGEALYFFSDYEGYTDLVCKDSIFRIDLFGNELMIIPIRKKDFEKYLLPVTDKAFGKYYSDDQWEKYPSFNHYAIEIGDTTAKILKNITNKDLMDMYNFEYYFLPPAMQMQARRLAEEYKADYHVVAALMSGFTETMFYEPLYAPLFILKDTICIFNHYNNSLYHFDRENKLIDSVSINYHHPKNWRHWKRKLLVDESEQAVYAFFSRDEHHYFKKIDFQTGKELFTYKLQNYSGRRIKIKDGYAYYVYKPATSLQEYYLYRERIN
ncbi:MAG: carboxypeptidase-like regulatory domain-containing protein [Bacteroidia bacterium]|nr:carboxypeptidase-like regulatory domain-containing protein [Bacteroidia bacterium]